MSNYVGGPFSRIIFEQINLNSHQQVKDFLYTQGWQPTTWNYNKETKERTSPKLTEDSFDSIKGELGQLFARRAVLRHRRNSISNFDDPENKGLLAYLRSDGRVGAEADTLGTPTSRYTHRSPVCNIPGADAILGEEMRRCYCVLPPYKMIGADLVAIEACVMAHYTMPYDDGKIAKDLLVKKGEPDWHSKNADDIYTPYRPDRPVSRGGGKGISYMLIYGGGAPKCSSMLGVSKKDGHHLFNYFWEYNEGLRVLRDKLVDMYKRNGYILGLDGRRLYIRAEYKLLNSLFQSAAAVIYKTWMVLAHKYLINLDISQIIAYHDENQYRCIESEVSEAIPLIEQSAVDAGESFGIRVPTLADCKVGMNWFDTH